MENLEINIGKIWQSLKKEKNFIKQIQRCLDKIKKEMRPAFAITLIGKEPAVLFLLVQYMLYGIVGEVWYQENEKSKAIKIR